MPLGSLFVYLFAVCTTYLCYAFIHLVGSNVLVTTRRTCSSTHILRLVYGRFALRICRIYPAAICLAALLVWFLPPPPPPPICHTPLAFRSTFPCTFWCSLVLSSPRFSSVPIPFFILRFPGLLPVSGSNRFAFWFVRFYARFITFPFSGSAVPITPRCQTHVTPHYAPLLIPVRTQFCHYPALLRRTPRTTAFPWVGSARGYAHAGLGLLMVLLLPFTAHHCRPCRACARCYTALRTHMNPLFIAYCSCGLYFHARRLTSLRVAAAILV